MMMMIIFIATIMVAYIGARTAEKLDGDLIKWAGSINLSINQSINQSIHQHHHQFNTHECSMNNTK